MPEDSSADAKHTCDPVVCSTACWNVCKTLAALLLASAMSLAPAICWTKVSTHSSGDFAFASVFGCAQAALVPADVEGPTEGSCCQFSNTNLQDCLY